MKKNITRILILSLMLILTIGILTSCDNSTSSEEKVVNDGPFTITVDGGFLNNDPSITTGIFAKGESVTITAIIPKGKEFVKWYKTGVPSSKFSSENPYTFTVAANRQLSAEVKDIELPKYDITVVNGYIGTDTSTKSGKYEEDSKITLTAIVPAGKVFSGWYVDSVCVSKSNPYEYEVTKKATVTANLRNEGDEPEEEEKCLLTITGGKIDGYPLKQKLYNNGDIVVVVADVPSDKNFDGWYENDVKVSSKQSFTFVIKYSRNLEAKCVAKPYYSINVTDGTIDTNNSVMQGTDVKFTANADTDRKEFEKWTITKDGISTDYTNREVTLSATSDITAVAHYYNKILVNAYIVGEDEPFDHAYIRSGSGEVEFTAPVKDNVSFNRWIDSNGNRLASTLKYTVQAKSEDYSIYAEYVNVQEGYSKITIFMGEAYTSYSGGIYGGTKLGSDFTVAQGTNIYIKPTRSDATVTYDSPREGQSGITLNKTYGCNLAVSSVSYQINCISTIPVTLSNCICTTTLTNNKVIVGETYVFEESFNTDDFAFVQWKVNNVASIGTPSVVDNKHYISVTITSDMESININVLLRSKFTISLINGTFEDGSTEGNYVDGSFVTIYADTIQGKTFKEWQCDNTYVSNQSELVITVIDNATYVAIYE